MDEGADRGPERWWRPSLGDTMLAVASAVLGASITWGLVEGSERAPALALTVAHSAFLLWRRRCPEATLAGLGATAGLFVAMGWPSVGLGPAVLAGAHGLGAGRDRGRAAPWLAACIAAMAAVVSVDRVRPDTIVGNAVALTAAWWLGDRQRRVEERAHRVEQEAATRAAEAVAAERSRIARELHDVVAHALSLISVQAGTGRVVIDDDPAAARTALAEIERASRSALGEMRTLLHVLRSDDDGSLAPLVPSPGLRQLDELVAGATRNGLEVDVHVEGRPGALPPGVDLAAYRIVQEALTNVRRHAGATRADVTLGWRSGALDVEVVDDGHGADGRSSATGGNGIVGMRERVSLYGGSLDVGNRRPRGFRVVAHLPFGEST